MILYLSNGMKVEVDEGSEDNLGYQLDIPCRTIETHEADRQKLWVIPKHVVAYRK